MSRGALIIAGFVLLFVLHQDFWWRDDASLVLGLVPVSLAYHIVWTLLVAAGWMLLVKRAWPAAWDESPASEGNANDQTGEKRFQAKAPPK